MLLLGVLKGDKPCYTKVIYGQSIFQRDEIGTRYY